MIPVGPQVRITASSITTSRRSTSLAGSYDPIGGTTKQLNDVVVAFLPTSTGTGSTQMPPTQTAPTIAGSSCLNGCTLAGSAITFADGTGGTFQVQVTARLSRAHSERCYHRNDDRRYRVCKHGNAHLSRQRRSRSGSRQYCGRRELHSLWVQLSTFAIASASGGNMLHLHR